MFLVPGKLYKPKPELSHLEGFQQHHYQWLERVEIWANYQFVLIWGFNKDKNEYKVGMFLHHLDYLGVGSNQISISGMFLFDNELKVSRHVDFNWESLVLRVVK